MLTRGGEIGATPSRDPRSTEFTVTVESLGARKNTRGNPDIAG